MEEKFYLRRMIDLTKTWEVVGDAEKKKEMQRNSDPATATIIIIPRITSFF